MLGQNLNEILIPIESRAPSLLESAHRRALTTGDIDKLYDLGANPYLIRRVFRSRFKI